MYLRLLTVSIYSSPILHQRLKWELLYSSQVKSALITPNTKISSTWALRHLVETFRYWDEKQVWLPLARLIWCSFLPSRPRRNPSLVSCSRTQHRRRISHWLRRWIRGFHQISRCSRSSIPSACASISVSIPCYFSWTALIFLCSPGHYDILPVKSKAWNSFL